MFEKPLEYWAALAGMVLYTASRDAENEIILRRVAKIFASALLTIGTSPTFAAYLKISEILAAVLIMAVGLIALDVLTAIISDREFIKDLVRQRLGKKDK